MLSNHTAANPHEQCAPEQERRARAIAGMERLSQRAPTTLLELLEPEDEARSARESAETTSDARKKAASSRCET